MAFSRGEIRKILSAAGVAEEAIEEASTKLVKLHMDVVDPLKAENDSIGTKDKAIEKLRSQLEKAETELETYKSEDYKTKYETEKASGEKLKKEYEDYKTEQGRKAARTAKESAFKDILKDANIPEKHYAKIIKYSDIDSLELDDKGKITTAKDVLKAVKDEWSDHIETTTEEGAPASKPPANTGGTSKPLTKAEIYARDDKGHYKLSSEERQKAIAENPAEFGI